MKVQRNIWRYISSYKQREKLHYQKERKIGKSENIFRINISAQFSAMFMNFGKLPFEVLKNVCSPVLKCYCVKTSLRNQILIIFPFILPKFTETSHYNFDWESSALSYISFVNGIFVFFVRNVQHRQKNEETGWRSFSFSVLKWEQYHSDSDLPRYIPWYFTL